MDHDVLVKLFSLLLDQYQEFGRLLCIEISQEQLIKS